MNPIRLAISACLLGQPVRWDGALKLDEFLRDTLCGRVDCVPVCPEVECGLGVPREAMRLIGDPGVVRLLTVHTLQDLTERMQTWAAARLEELASERLCGFIFKSRSPSCGLWGVPVFDASGASQPIGRGLFSAAVVGHFAGLPVSEDEPLHDPSYLTDFLARVNAYAHTRGA